MNQKNNLNKIIYFLISFITATTFNIYTSTLLSEKAKYSESFLPFLKLNYLENTGAAFSILQNSPIFLISFSVIATILIITYLIRNLKTLNLMRIFFISILTSGIVCNLIERIHYGYVRDYFDFINSSFPVFNISDIYINISVIAIMVLLYKKGKN